MANPIPCGKCNEVADADLLVTDRTPEFTLLGVPTTGMCVMCYINHAMELANALSAAMAEMEGGGETPGVLEQVEADEGEVIAADPIPAAPKSRKRSAGKDGAAQWAANVAAIPTDENGETVWVNEASPKAEAASDGVA